MGLPVMQTCNDCAWCNDAGDGVTACAKTPLPWLDVGRAEVPPDWCPLRAASAPDDTVQKWSERFAVECWNRLFPDKVFPPGTLGDATMREMGPIVLAKVGPPPAKCTCGSGGHPRPCVLHPHGFAEHILALNEETIRDEAYERAAKACEEHAAGADDGVSDGAALAARIRALSTAPAPSDTHEELRLANECVELAAQALSGNHDAEEARVAFWDRRAALGHAGHPRAEREQEAAYDARAADCARGLHRYATRQTTGKETCIDCYVEEQAPSASRPLPKRPDLGVDPEDFLGPPDQCGSVEPGNLLAPICVLAPGHVGPHREMSIGTKIIEGR